MGRTAHLSNELDDKTRALTKARVFQFRRLFATALVVFGDLFVAGKAHDIGADVFAQTAPRALSGRTRQRHATAFATACLRRLARFAHNVLAVIHAVRTVRLQSRRAGFAYTV